MPSPEDLRIQFLMAKKHLKTNGSLSIKIISGSMEPVIKVNDQVTVNSISEPLKPFDIIVYKNDRELICHYVKHINRHVTQGDNNLVQTRGLNAKTDDTPVHFDDILGVVVSHKISAWRKLLLIWAIR